MNFLLDTNIVSEWTRPRPDPGVVTWLAEADEDRVFISVVTLAELRHGIERMPDGARRARLDAWLSEQMKPRFEARILPVDEATAEIWGRVMGADSKPAGRSARWTASSRRPPSATISRSSQGTSRISRRWAFA